MKGGKDCLDMSSENILRAISQMQRRTDELLRRFQNNEAPIPIVRLKNYPLVPDRADESIGIGNQEEGGEVPKNGNVKFVAIGIKTAFDAGSMNKANELGSFIRANFRADCIFFIPLRRYTNLDGGYEYTSNNEESAAFRLALMNKCIAFDLMENYLICRGEWSGCLIPDSLTTASFIEAFDLNGKDLFFGTTEVTGQFTICLKRSGIEKVVKSVASANKNEPTGAAMLDPETQRQKKAQDAWVKIRMNGAETQRGRLAKQLDELKKQKQDMLSKQLDLDTRITDTFLRLSYLEANPDREEESFIDEFKQFNGNPRDPKHIDGIIRAEYDTEKNNFVFYTDTIYALRQDTKAMYYIGKFKIVIPLDSNDPDTIRITNLSMKEPGPATHYDFAREREVKTEIKMRKECGRNFNHPHVSPDGSACWGNVKPDLRDMMQSKKSYPEMAILIVMYLRTWNPNDTWGKNIVRWPEVDPATLEFKEPELKTLIKEV